MNLNSIKNFSIIILISLSLHVQADIGWTASETDVMEGFPPPSDKRVTVHNFMSPPYNRWALQHIREIQPTKEIYRGSGPVANLKLDKLNLSSISTKVRDNREMSLTQFLDETSTDSFLILHRGKIVFEKYMNGMQQHTQHQMFSATKSFVGTLMLILIEQGKVDPSKNIIEYLPEMKGSAFEDATVQQVMDMTTAINYTEVYNDQNSDIWRYGRVFSLWDHPDKNYSGPQTVYEYLPTLKKKGEHGNGFHYVTPNTDVLGWIISRITGKSLSHNLEETFWQRLGVERDGYIWLDKAGTEMAGGGLNITTRDAARFGQMIIQKGHYNGQQIIPENVAERILKPGNPEVYARYYPGNPFFEDYTFAYHDQWWTYNNIHKAVSAIGIHGQYIYLDPKAEMVVVKTSSSPDGEDNVNDVDGPLIYQVIAEYLMKHATDN